MVAPMSAAAAAGRAKRSWFTARSVAKATGGDVLQDGATGQAVATDTREECAGSVFVALRGDQHDSHDYLDRAVARGCAGLVVDRDVDVAALLDDGPVEPSIDHSELNVVVHEDLDELADPLADAPVVGDLPDEIEFENDGK